MRYFFSFFIFFTFLFPVFSQSSKSESKPDPGIILNFSYGYGLPAKDLALDYGNNFELGLRIEYLTENNLIFGITGNYFFGKDVKNDVLRDLRDERGNIYGINETYADIWLRERGFCGGAHAGKLFNFTSGRGRSGIRLIFSTGFFQHKIRVQDDPESTVPQLEGDYKKGYDHLTNGIGFNEFIGYQKLSANKRLNFIVGFTLHQAITKNRRDWNINLDGDKDRTRVDLVFGFSLGWTLPFYLTKSDEIYY